MPSIDGKAYTPTLGGHNCAITTNCKNKATALKFVKWWTSKESEQYNLEKQSNAPIYGELYTKDENVKKLPYLPTLKASSTLLKGVLMLSPMVTSLRPSRMPSTQLCRARLTPRARPSN